MTCIAAITDGKTVWMVSDSAGCDNGTVYLRKEGKVFRNGEFIIGSSGSMRMSQVLKHCMDLPPIEGDIMAYMATTFAEQVRTTLRNSGFLENLNGIDGIEGHLIVGVHGRLFTIDGHVAVMEAPEPFAAIGIGRSEALGVLYVAYDTLRNGFHLDDVPWHGSAPDAEHSFWLRTALECSERFNTDVRGPWHFLRTEG